MAEKLRKRQHTPGEKARLILSVALLLVVVVLVCGWLILKLHGNEPKSETEPTSDLPVETYTKDDIDNLLLIMTDEGYERFVLVQNDPVKPAIRVAYIPGNTDTGGGQTPTVLFRKYGAASVVNALSEVLDLPIEHYFALSAEETETFINYLEKGVSVDLPEAVKYADKNGSSLRLSEGENHLTATQTVTLMRYDDWQNPQNSAMPAHIVAAILNRYFREERYFAADFAALSNCSKTDLRITDLTLSQNKLSFLAAHNDGSLASLVTLSGEEKSGLFIPSRKKNDLYH